MKRRLICATLSIMSTGAFAAEACMDNFKVEGNFLTGKTYATSVLVAGVTRDQAFSKAMGFTVAHGFTVTSSNHDAGVISAQQSVSYAKGKSVPLSIVIQPEADKLQMSMTYATPGGVTSPEDAIKKHFCATIAAASEGGNAVESTENTGIVRPLVKTQQPHMRGFALATAQQQAGYKQEVVKLAKEAKIKAMVEEAAPEIAGLIEKEACLADSAGASAFGVHAAPGSQLANRYKVIQYPMLQARYHDRGQCMSVKRVNGWKAPANNALQFEVLYTAADSGETATMSHELVRQSDGSWLFTR